MDEDQRDPHSLSDRSDPSHRYEHAFDPTDNARALQKGEEDAGQFTNPNPGKPSDIQNQEENQPLNTAAPWDTNISKQPTSGRRSLMSRAKSFMMDKKKGPATAIGVFIIGAVVSGGLFFSGTLAPLFFINNVTLDLNDQLSALNIASNILFKHKMTPFSNSQTTTLGCTKVGAALSKKCAFATLSKNHRERLERVGFKIEGDDLFAGRTKPTRISYNGRDFSPSQLTEAFRTDRNIFNAIATADNMSFIGLRSKTITERVLPKFGRTGFNAPNISGDYDERVEKLRQIYSGDGTNRTPKFVEAKEGDTHLQKDGENAFWLDTDNDLDENGNRRLYTDGETKTIIDTFDKVKAIDATPTQFSPGKLKAYRALNALAVADGICDLRNMVGSATVAAKVSNSVQQARYFLDMAAFVGKLYLQTATPEDADFIQRVFNDADARKTLDGWTKQSDGSFNFNENEEGNPVPNPTYGMSAMDSPLYHASTNGGVPATSTVDQNYSLGFGANSTLRAAGTFLNVFDTVTSGGGALDGSSCEIIQNKWVRGLGYVAGIILGGISFGGFTAVNGAVNVAIFVGIYMAGWALNSALQGNLITDTLLTTASVERGSAIWTGMSVVLGQTALSRGMMPGNAEEIVAYQLEQNTARQQYIALERQNADPFDMNNPYSLSATMAFSVASHIPKNVSVNSVSSSVASLVSDGFGSIISPYTARASSLDPERFELCDDKSYTDIGISADVQCNVRYVMPSKSLDVNPLEIAQWMEDQGYVEKDTTTGFPKDYSPPDGGKQQNIAKQFIMGVIDPFYDTRDYGQRVNPETGAELGANDYGVYLDFCVYRALPFGETYEEFGQINGVDHNWRTGENCRKTNDEKINKFRAYTFYLSANDDLDEGPVESNLNCGPSSTSGVVNGTAGTAADAAKIDEEIEKMEKSRSVTSPLHGKGEFIVQMANKYGINVRYIATTFRDENGFATDGSPLFGEGVYNFGNNVGSADNPGTCGYGNTFGSTTYDRSYKKYCTVEEGIEGTFKNLIENKRYKEEADASTGAAAGTVAAVRNIYCPPGDGLCNLDNFMEVSVAIGMPMEKSDPVFVAPPGGVSGNVSGGVATSVAKMSETQLQQLIATYELPPPQAKSSPDILVFTEPTKGYEELLAQLKDNPKAGWAAQSLLNGEKKWKSAGGEIKEYLNTAWLWFETGQSAWPDPYQMNCQSDSLHPGEKYTLATDYCPTNDFQTAGYQGENRKNDYVEVFNKLYSENELVPVMQNVIKNSTNAFNDKWNYNDSSNNGSSSYFSDLSGVTLNDISPNKDFFDTKTQLLTLILGKDPNMAAALNSFAVTDDDVLKALRNCDSLWWAGYLCTAPQLVSNMIYALYLFDGAGPTGSAICDDGRAAAGSALPGWVITTDPDQIMDYRVGKPDEPAILFKHAMLDNRSTDFVVSQLHGPNNSRFALKERNGMYKNYDFPSYGFDAVGHPGYDISMDLGTKLYAGVEGTVVTAGGSGFFYHTPGTKNEEGKGELKIQLSNGDEVILGHMQSIVVKVGDKVTAGTYVGESGYEDGPHLHLEYRKKDSSCTSGFCIVDPTHHIP